MSYSDHDRRETGGVARAPVAPRQRSRPAPRRPEPPSATDVGVRPYLLTRGRTRSDRPIKLEALVQTTAYGRDSQSTLHFEHRAIARLCERAVSVAEVAARIDVPLGVARVLIVDLAAEGILQIHDVPDRIEDDIPLIQRLIHGVRAL